MKFGFHHMNDLLNDLDEEEHAEAVAQSEALLAGDGVWRERHGVLELTID